MNPLLQILQSQVSLPQTLYTAVSGRNSVNGRSVGPVEQGIAIGVVGLTVAGLGAEVPAIRAGLSDISYLRPFFGEAALSNAELKVVGDIASGYNAAVANGGVIVDAAFSLELSTNCYIMAEVQGGVLTTAVRARDASIAVRGTELFRRMWAAIGDRVRVIRGTWTFETNLADYNAARLAGLSREAAAARTWTGRRAAELGFTRVQVLLDLGSGVGRSRHVEVHFLRP